MSHYRLKPCPVHPHNLSQCTLDRPQVIQFGSERADEAANKHVLKFLLMYTTGRIQFCHGQFVYQVPLKIPTYIISMYPLTRILSQLLEFLVLELKEFTEVERVDESPYKVGSTLSSSIRYLNTVILYIKFKRRLHPGPVLLGFSNFVSHGITVNYPQHMRAKCVQ